MSLHKIFLSKLLFYCILDLISGTFGRGVQAFRVMAYFTYVLYSIEYKRFYKGHCENLKNRLADHNSGFTKSTKPYIPWIIIYFEEFDSRDKAIKREKYFKSAAGRRFLKKKIFV